MIYYPRKREIPMRFQTLGTTLLNKLAVHDEGLRNKPFSACAGAVLEKERKPLDMRNTFM